MSNKFVERTDPGLELGPGPGIGPRLGSKQALGPEAVTRLSSYIYSTCEIATIFHLHS